MKPLKLRPASGPGSRQPMLKLPSTMPDGKRTPLHPLIYLMRKHADDDTGNKSDVARKLGVRPQSFYKWERACKADRHFPLPVLRAQQLAEHFNVPPSLFRPDFPWSTK